MNPAILSGYTEVVKLIINDSRAILSGYIYNPIYMAILSRNAPILYFLIAKSEILSDFKNNIDIVTIAKIISDTRGTNYIDTYKIAKIILDNKLINPSDDNNTLIKSVASCRRCQQSF